MGFTAIPLISLLTPLVALPLLARSVTVQDFVSVAVGQSVGALGALVVAYGWSVTGPAEVARCDPQQRPALWRESVRTRFLVYVVVAPAALVGARLVDPGESWLAGIVAVASLVGGMTVTWYAVGTGRPGILALYDAMPRAVGNLTGVGMVVLTGWVALFPVGDRRHFGRSRRG